MNSYSQLFYFADVASDVNAVCGFLFYGGCIVLLIYAIIKGICKAANAGYDDDPISPSIGHVAKRLWVPVVLAGIIGVIAPSSNTVYAIAASEFGEEVLSTPTAGKAARALDAWLDRQIAGPPVGEP